MYIQLELKDEQVCKTFKEEKKTGMGARDTKFITLNCAH